jgi:hypothetical protein
MGPEEVEAEYQRRNASSEGRGWSFAYTPIARLRTAKVVQIALNPHGDEGDVMNSWETTVGKSQNAFVDQRWGKTKELNELQKQVISLYSALGVEADEVFAANLVPFTSPSWEDLPQREEALEFSRRLWEELLPQALHTRLFVVLGEEVRKALVDTNMRSLIGLADGALPQWHDFGWKKRSIGEYDLDGGRKLLTLPHLSRNRIFSGETTTARAVISEIAKHAGLPGFVTEGVV